MLLLVISIYLSIYLENRLIYLHMPSQLGLYNTPTAPLQRGKPSTNECPGYNTKKSDGEAPVMLEL